MQSCLFFVKEVQMHRCKKVKFHMVVPNSDSGKISDGSPELRFGENFCIITDQH